MGDFSMQPTDNNFQTFCESHDLYNLIKDKTYFKAIEGTCIDLILTNQKHVHGGDWNQRFSQNDLMSTEIDF